MKQSWNRLSCFWLRIIALVTMTFDHIGVAYYTLVQKEDVFYNFCRVVGRFALPLFCFLVVEGVIHTKSFKKYFFKLSILAVVISITLAICQYVTQLNAQELATAGNIFVDLALGALMLWCLKNKNYGIKFCALIPIGISIASFAARAYEFSTVYQANWYPKFLRMQYDWMSLLMILGFYCAYLCTNLFYKARESSTGLSAETMKGTNEWRIAVNLFSILILLVVQGFYYLMIYISPSIVFWDAKIQLVSVATGLILLFYNGSRGYNAKWFRWFSYLYYPLHLVVICVVVLIIQAL